MNDFEKLDVFVKRMKKLGISLELIKNYPWIYIDKVNGNKVKEKYMANHGFTLAFLPIRRDKELHFTDISVIFKIIRKYGCNKNIS